MINVAVFCHKAQRQSIALVSSSMSMSPGLPLPALGGCGSSGYVRNVPFGTIKGQAGALGTITRALRSRRVHHALRFEGPPGVGKETTALALVQALVCTGGDPLGCGVCSACHRAVQLCAETPAVPLHPDVIFVERGLYPPETIGKNRPETQEISVDQIRSVVLERIPFPPHEGRARVFLIRRAEELSLSAANALLKTLEEPGQDTYFVLLTSRPARLPQTVHSRTLRVRFGPLPDSVLMEILESHGIDRTTATTLIPLAAGSASLALSLADPNTSKQRDAFVEAALLAIGSETLVPTLDLADTGVTDRATLRNNLEALAARIAHASRNNVAHNPSRATSLAGRYEIIVRAIRELDRNASPALLLESMMLRLRAVVG